MVLALLRHLDPLGSDFVSYSHAFNTSAAVEGTAYIARNGETERSKQWDTTGGDSLRIDYVFTYLEPGSWRRAVALKKTMAVRVPLSVPRGEWRTKKRA